MGWTPNRRLPRLVAGLTLGLALATTGCGDSVFGLDADGAQIVRVALSVDDGAGEITFVSSNSFRLEPLGTRVNLYLQNSDTVTSALPVDQRFDTGLQRQFVFVVTDRSAIPTPIRLRVWLDDELRLESSFPQGGADIRLVYFFGGGLVLQNVEVI